jgi:integrase
MGKIRITKAGYLYFDFCFNGKRFREYTKMKNSPENMALMLDAMKNIDHEIHLITFDYSKYFPGSRNISRLSENLKSNQTFEEYSHKWYRNNKISWKPSVRRDFDSTLHRHLIPFFKEKKICDITKSMIKEFRASLAELKGRRGRLSNKRINNILAVLRLIINEAAEEFDFQTPFINLKPLPIRKPDIMPFSLDEVLAFLKQVRKDFYNYYVVRFFTGMRTAEIDGLQWIYVDFANKKILIRETWQNKQWVSPKTESSVRDIDISQLVAEALLMQKETTGVMALVFCNGNGSPLDSSNISKRIWYPTLKQVGLPLRNPYQTRHTAATLWLAAGENPEWVARQLGHSNTEMLFKVYSKYIPNLTRKDGSAFESILTSALNKQPERSKNGLLLGNHL